ncbi:hypothetical protein D3C73_710580 [compost metagenome]
MPTSRYCDHMSCSIRKAFKRMACSEPGTIERRLSPITPCTVARTASALAASPPACSSITRSIMLAAKVTPAALITCKSRGGSKYGLDGSASGPVLASRASTLAMKMPGASRTAERGASDSSKSLKVAKCSDRSNTPSARRTIGEGPAIRPGTQARPIRVPATPSAGRVFSGVSISDMAIFLVRKDFTLGRTADKLQ